MDFLVHELNVLRVRSTRESWQHFVKDVFSQHPVWRFAHESPFSRRAYEKPRGYPGDAKILDFIYGLEDLPEDTSDLGRAVYQFEFNSPSCRSVRARRNVLASKIDEVAAQQAKPNIVSIACGHLREVALSKAIQNREFGEFVGVDQDAASLSVLTRAYGSLGVRAVAGSVRSILTSKLRFENVDLIYAAGLYDYLDDAVAKRLTAGLFSMLRPGGVLLVANFAPELSDIGYMEACMDWWLVYRGEHELAGVAEDIRPDQIARMSLFRDKPGNIVFLELQRNGN
jgi:hypothetical protein